MLRLEKFEAGGKWADVIRDGNNKIVFLYGGEPYAIIAGRVLFTKKFHSTDVSQELLSSIREFAKAYLWAYDTEVESDLLTIHFGI